MIQKSFILLMVILQITTFLHSQNTEPRNVNVETLSDTQIRKIIAEVEKRGLSEQEAINLATAYGLNASQINILRQRMLALNKVKETSYQVDTFSKESTNLLLTQKKEFSTKLWEKSVFGFHLFNSENLTFEPSVNIPVSSAYVVGPGDGFLIDIFGASQQQYSLTVDKNGLITIPNVGPVNVGGFELNVAEKRIFDRLTLIYRDLISAQPRTFANIQISTVKAIKVNVIGEVFAPGTYTLPGTASAFNALYLSGGPNYNGSFRSIKIIRNGKEVAELDVYDYLINGNSKVNVPLRDGDVILIPTYQNRVRVGGDFIRTGIFESKNGETVADLLKYTGGFTEYAYRNRLELHRNNGREIEMVDIFQDAFNQIAVQSGDSLFAGKILSRFANRVSIDGAVFRPGAYELTKGLTLKQLIDKADGVREDAFLERGLILRLNDDLSLSNISFNVSDIVGGRNDIELKREDAVTISPLDSMREQRIVNIFGEIIRPGFFDFRERMTLGDLIKLAGGFKESASESFIEVTRRLDYEEAAVYETRNVKLFQFTVPRSLSLSNKDAGFELKPFDQVYIRKAPGFTQTGYITISGEVLYSGQYGISRKNERLSEIIRRAGGLTPDAYPTGAMLTRKIELSPKARRLREILKESTDGVAFSELGFEIIGVDLAKAIKNPGSRDDIIIRDGDELVIPRKLLTVNVEGEVLNPITIPYIEGKGLKYYVNQGGGFAVRAKKNKAYVVYPNGTAAATRNVLFFNSYPAVKPGSQIVIPQKPERERMPATAWIGIGSGISSLALTIITIVNSTK